MSQPEDSSIPNRFDFAAAASRISQRWDAAGCWRATVNPQRRPFTIVIPPPNVTGALHLGHGLNNTLQDVLIRTRRMQGFEALWVPGTDHAGIATQAVVERRLKEQENLTRHDLGREALVQRIWQWKDQYETRILSQLKRMGCSCDWDRTRFTLDDRCAAAVRATFYDLFRQRLIYRGKRLVNWDTFLQTAISDDEVFNETVKGNFWHIRYRVIAPQPGEPDTVEIATTRPETLLGDTAVAVHPDPAAALEHAIAQLRDKTNEAGERDRVELNRQLAELIARRDRMLPGLLTLRDMALAGRQLILPLMDRPIPLIADPWAKPEMGSGCVKITPAHDANDYEVGLRCGLPMINILNPDGTLNAAAGPYQGLTIKQARERVVAELDVLGQLGEVEDRDIELPHSDRSKTPIEPLLADQWFVKMDSLAQSAIEAVESERVKIFPTRYRKGYLDWLGEKRDWPVSRQLWWGHRIPIWSAGPMEPTEAEQLASRVDDLGIGNESLTHILDHDEAGQAFLFVCLRSENTDWENAIESLGLTRDPDVLDTWFSSALWPHSTLGWPEPTSELDYFYPTSTLITSRDIITLWVARMVLMGLNNTGQVPFDEVFIHPKILDGLGETMSKSKGNGVDPLDIIDKFGPDALRFALAWLATETQDVRMPVQYECPHCEKLVDQTKKNRSLPKIACPACGKSFSTQWAESAADRELPRGAVVSERFETARNFVNKLWNAARFTLLNLDDFTPVPVDRETLPLEDRWLLSRLSSVTAEVTESLDHYRYAEAARVLYDFAWDEFCSLYVEMAKARLADPVSRPATQTIIAHSLDQLLRLLHPFMPFVTEEIWDHLGQVAPRRGLTAGADDPGPFVMLAPWPTPDAQDRVDDTIERQFAVFREVLGAVRKIRSSQNIAPRESVPVSVRCDAEIAELLTPMKVLLESLATANVVDLGPQATAFPTDAALTIPAFDIDVHVDLEQFIDVDAELQRLQRLLTQVAKQITGKQQKLANENFVSRAPAQVVDQERLSLDELLKQQTGLAADIDKLQARIGT
ncbi:MAG: valine--tRNA ligase [Planctomycetaceae bacterium]|nr:MAG: valine--tRNA ligase [Planctomycetaceae bacterium]